jgi:hypothetical protein
MSGTNKKATIPDNPGPQTLDPGAQSPIPFLTRSQEPKEYPGGTFRYSFILGRIDYSDDFSVLVIGYISAMSS